MEIRRKREQDVSVFENSKDISDFYLKLMDSVTDIKHKVDEALDMIGAVAASQDHPELGVLDLGEEDVPIIFKPLLSSPKVPLAIDNGGLDLSDIEGLTLQQIKRI